MANISKINALALANIAKVDAITKANIAKVNGLDLPSGAFTGLLDTYTGAAAAYSTRRLATSATNLIRIREDAGDTETDIGYDSNNELDTAAIATHCGSANGLVVTWYDQSGNSNNATQTSHDGQPKIYDGSAVLLQGGKPAVLFDGTSDHFDTTPNNPFTFTGGISCIAAVYKAATSYKEYEAIISAGATGVGSTNSKKIMAFGYGNNPNLPSAKRPSFVTDIWTPSGVQYDGTLSTNERRLLGWYISNWSTHRSTGLSNMTLNGSDISTTTYGSVNPTGLNTNPMKIGVLDEVLNSSYFAGSIQELIVYASDKNSDRNGIQTLVNNYFGIY